MHRKAHINVITLEGSDNYYIAFEDNEQMYFARDEIAKAINNGDKVVTVIGYMGSLSTIIANIAHVECREERED